LAREFADVYLSQFKGLLEAIDFLPELNGREALQHQFILNAIMVRLHQKSKPKSNV